MGLLDQDDHVIIALSSLVCRSRTTALQWPEDARCVVYLLRLVQVDNDCGAYIGVYDIKTLMRALTQHRGENDLFGLPRPELEP